MTAAAIALPLLGLRITAGPVELEPASLVRFEHALTVEGLPAFRRSLGLPTGE